ncbi:FUSC family protein [Marinactinospora endophytica]
MNDLPSKRPGPLTRLLRSLSPRDALRLRVVFGGVVVPSLRIGLCVAIPLAVTFALGRLDLAPYAPLGSFTALYCRDTPYGRRARVLATVGAGLTLCVLVGALTSLLTANGIVKIAVIALVAALAKFAADTLSFGPPAGLMFVFAAGAAAYAPQTWAALPLVVGTTAASALLCWCVSMAGRLLHRTAPQRLATARALVAVASLLTASDTARPAARHQAHLAVQRSWLVLGDGSVAAGSETVRRLEALTARAETLLHVPAERLPKDTAAELRDLAWRTRLRRVPEVTSTDTERAELRSRAQQVATGPAAGGPAHRLSQFLPGATRVGAASLVAGLAGIALGFDHAYWALVSASAVLQTVNVTTTWHRTIQRVAGTLLGAGLAVVIFGFDPGPAALLAVIVLCQLGAELLILTNYAFAILFATPLTLAITQLAHPADGAVTERVLATVVGALIGVVVSIVLVDPGATRRLRAALVECRAAEARARAALERTPREAGPALDRLARAVIALREAHAVAGGEPWTTGFSAEEVTAAEHAAYELLAVPARVPSGFPAR